MAEQAKSAGMDVPTYAARVLQAAVSRPSLDALLEPIRKQFAKTGISGEQAAEHYEAEKHAARVAKRGRTFDE